MRLLNLCSGATRPPEPWTNLDDLHATLAPGTPERLNLDAESNYVNFDLGSGPLPFPDNTFTAICASHCIEHFNLLKSVEVLKECRRVLAPDGSVIVSVPDASIFRSKYPNDKPENAERIFGESIFPGEGDTFMSYAGFNKWHLQLFSFDSLWCVMKQSGLHPLRTMNLNISEGNETLEKVKSIINRWPFSLVMIGQKT